MNFVKKNIYYLNIEELINICQRLGIDPYYYIEKNNNSLTKGRLDKKIKIIKNILKILENKPLFLTIIPKKVVKFKKLLNPTQSTKIYYGQYINGNKQILKLMKKLTNNQFKFGVIAQDILFNYWKKGILLTYKQLAKKWINYQKKSHPEWKFIDYIKKTGSLNNWKIHCKKMANQVIKKINKLKKELNIIEV